MSYYAMQTKDGLYHHGKKGQKWGVRNAEWYPIEDYKEHLNRTRISNKYQNIDGSLNEKGIDHRYKFAKKKIEKNNKYYDNQINKYKKKLSETEDTSEKKYLKSRIDNAERTRKQVNKYISNMDIEDIVNIENETKEKILKAVGTTASLAAVTGIATTVPKYVSKGIAATSNFLSNVDPDQTIESIYALANSSAGKKAMKYVDTGIRSYTDVRAYMLSIAAEQAIRRMTENGTFDMIAETAENVTSNTSKQVNNAFSEEMYKLIKQYT